MIRFWEKLPPSLWATARAQLVWKIAGISALVVLPLGLEIWSWFSASHNARLNEALSSVQSARADLSLRKQRAQGIAMRYARQAPPLSGLLEQEAKKAGVQLADSTDRPDVSIGKIYTERQTTVHVKKSGLVPILLLLEGIEQSGYPLSIPRLSLKKRSGEPDAYDVELGVSAYDRSAVAAKEKDKEEKP